MSSASPASPRLVVNRKKAAVRGSSVPSFSVTRQVVVLADNDQSSSRSDTKAALGSSNRETVGFVGVPDKKPPPPPNQITTTTTSPASLTVTSSTTTTTNIPTATHDHHQEDADHGRPAAAKNHVITSAVRAGAGAPPPPPPPPARGGHGIGHDGRSVRHVVKYSARRFDVNMLPIDMRRVYRELESKYGEEYGLIFVFMMNTAIELHRAWHMTLLTSKILQQIKDTYGIVMTWNLGVVRLIFRVEDGGHELQRKVPYDYDSEFQDLYMKIAVALIERRISVHEALIFQAETRRGLHTANTGLFLRNFPGRLVLYPIEAATCAVIFFGGNWTDGYVAAICGIVSGLIEYVLVSIGGDAKVLIDISVGVSTGIIGSLFYRLGGESRCLSAIFLGTLYWFFYGTAFVIGLLEIIAGELETGVTRFIAVSVKTFVLCLGASFGMLLALPLGEDTWLAQEENCGTIDLGAVWWRIPLYLLSSASALGQYRMPIVVYWRGLTVQLAAYEVQYQLLRFLTRFGDLNNADNAASNVMGAVAAVITACAIASLVNRCQSYYFARLLQRGNQTRHSFLGNAVYWIMKCTIHVGSFIWLEREMDKERLRLEKKLQQQAKELRDVQHPRTQIDLDPDEEHLLVQCIVSAESLNIWSILMPALYQLVPGSMIARLWFSSIYPPPLKEEERFVPGTNSSYMVWSLDQEKDSIFSNLMVISASLALGLIIGFAIVQSFGIVWNSLFGPKLSDVSEAEAEQMQRERERYGGVYQVPDNDPDPIREDELAALQEEEKQADDDNDGTEDGLDDKLSPIEEYEADPVDNEPPPPPPIASGVVTQVDHDAVSH